MNRRLTVLNRLLSALVMASGVTLIVAGMAVYTSPPVPGDGFPSPIVIADGTPPPGSGAGAGDPRPSGSASAAPTETGSPPTPSSEPPAASATHYSTPSASANPSSPAGSAPPASASPSESPTAPASPAPSASPEVSLMSRVEVPSLRIDLAIVPPGGPDEYPLCDVAQYLSAYRQPGQAGTVYIYAHAREGMFLPLLTESQEDNGAGMLGKLVSVYTRDGHKYIYEIFKVKRHALDLAIANEVEPGEQRVVLQTSEGPRGHRPKLQVAARFLTVTTVPVDEANPRARPSDCS